MKVGVIQSNYLPWRGYFDFIKSVDLFVFHDDLQYTKQDWRNRNKIKTHRGLEWLTVPVKKGPVWTLIDEIEIAGEEWKQDHRNQLIQNLGRAKYFEDALEIWEICLNDWQMLSQMNVQLIKDICEYLWIKTPIIHSRSLNLTGAKTERLIQLCKKVGADTYLSGPNAKVYLDVQMMNENGIQVEWKEYNYLPYPQLHGQFEYFVTVLDLIANVGTDAKNHITSLSAEEMQNHFPHWNQ